MLYEFKPGSIQAHLCFASSQVRDNYAIVRASLNVRSWLTRRWWNKKSVWLDMVIDGKGCEVMELSF